MRCWIIVLLKRWGTRGTTFEFYVEYNAFCRLAECGIVKPQEDLPGPTHSMRWSGRFGSGRGAN
jgi:hypothetical protein